MAGAAVTAGRSIGVLLMVALVWGALAFGGAYPWAYWPLAAASAVLGIWSLTSSHGWREVRALHVTICLAVLACVMAVQMVPLPHAVFARISPAADRFLSQYDFSYGFNPQSWHSLSISPMDTLVTFLLFVAFALLLVGLMRSMANVGAEWLVTRLAILGVGLAFFAIVQRATIDPDAPVAYGFWKSQAGLRVVPFGPFFNRNHFAGWMVLATPLVLAYFCALLQASWRHQGRRLNRWLLWLTRPDAGRLMLIGFCVLAMGTSLVLTGSRSGIGSFAVAAMVLAYFVVRETSRRASRALALLGLLGLVLGAIVWAGATNAVARFSVASQDLPGRLAAWTDTLRIISSFPLFGTGFGTFGLAMLVYQTTDRAFIYVQAHNDYLQIAAEGGALIGIPVLITIGVIVRSIWARFDDGDDRLTAWIRAGAVASLLGIAAQSLMEFSLQMPGNTILFVVVLALALHRSDPFVRLAARNNANAHRV